MNFQLGSTRILYVSTTLKINGHVRATKILRKTQRPWILRISKSFSISEKQIPVKWFKICDLYDGDVGDLIWNTAAKICTIYTWYSTDGEFSSHHYLKDKSELNNKLLIQFFIALWHFTLCPKSDVFGLFPAIRSDPVCDNSYLVYPSHLLPSSWYGLATTVSIVIIVFNHM